MRSLLCLLELEMIDGVIEGLAEAIKRQSLKGVRAALATDVDPNVFVGADSMLGVHENEAWRITGSRP